MNTFNEDTSPEIENMVAARYRAMSGNERFMIGVQMFETARSLALASLSEDASQYERRRRLCSRFYPDLLEQVYPEPESK